MAAPEPVTIQKLLRPLYAVAFEESPAAVPGSSSWPIVPLGPLFDVGTAPHGLDLDVIEALPALWYCLQLPRTSFDIQDWPSAAALGLSHWLGAGHAILLIPTDDLGLLRHQTLYQPAYVFAPDRLVEDIAATVESVGFPHPVVPFSSLSDTSLKLHWQQLADMYDVPLPDDVPAPLVRRLDLAGVSIPRMQLRRALSHEGGEVHEPEEIEAASRDIWIRRANLQLIIDVESKLGVDDEIENLAKPGVEEVAKHLPAAKHPVSLVVPGQAPRYQRRAYTPDRIAAFEPYQRYDARQVWAVDPPPSDHAAERSALEFVGAYAAASRDGIALTLQQVPAEAWTALHQLESHVAQTGGGKTWKVAQLLERLDNAARPLWPADIIDHIAAASMVRVVSNFPLGLTTPPGFETPLASLLPVVQQPTTPLTQTLQLTLNGTHSLNLTEGCRVLVAECIPASELVGRASLRAFTSSRDHLVQIGSPVSVEVVESRSPAEVAEAIERVQPQILILSAHGHFPDDGTRSGLIIGDHLSMGDDLGPLPPVVLLSACSTAVRGDGGPTVADVLRRRGAIAVLGAQVPVNVYRNVSLLTRLLVNLHEVQTDGEAHAETLMDLWHHVQSSHLINDLLSTNENLLQWAFEPRAGRPAPVADFMVGIGRDKPIRRSHLLTDTVERLLHVADQSGARDRVRAWLPRKFVPESAFYHFVGDPDRIMLRPPPAKLQPPKWA